MTDEDAARVASLKKKLKARDGKAEYKANCEAIRAEIIRIEGKPDFDL